MTRHPYRGHEQGDDNPIRGSPSSRDRSSTLLSTLLSHTYDNHSTRYLAGTRCAIDIADYIEMDLGNHSKAIHAVDVGSGKMFTILLQSLSNLVDHLTYIHRQYLKAGHTLKVVVMDAQFVTETVSKYLDANQIELQQPSSYDHGQTGNGEPIHSWK